MKSRLFSKVGATAALGTAVLSFASFPVLAKPLVYVSVLPQKYLLEQIVGDKAEVEVLVQPGHNPHSYDPTGKQMAQLGKASLLFTTGVPFEDNWLPRISKLNPDLVLVDTTQGIEQVEMAAHAHHDENEDKEHGHDEHEDHDHDKHDADHEEHHGHKEHDHNDEHEHAHKDKHDAHEGHDDHKEAHHDHDEEHDDHHDHKGELDPHVWMNPLLAIKQADNMTHTLEKAFPESAESFEQGFVKLKQRLTALDHDIHEKLHDYEGRSFMVFHPAWGYFAKRYELEQIAIEFEGKSPSARQLTELVHKAEHENIKVILVQNQFNQKPAERIASHVNAKVVAADPLPYNLPEALEQLTQQLLESWQ
ncbi:metal ABC transporter solute-binding protein, Zn/Mn family [Oceanospirillum sediminis]|uniref:High-affinity zinc uptake system protein ZnuA n=1 Tax=Oceanospirillum sediminis TaxID=2760088 RepID=A0A839IXK2_9GAMM|nr:zinc ABC transporter substrate-binding protein [Oceanospirillum sediminis]MBB1489107.1 zinc ABC transporter substrate-binding protein [Oceanospirillum sediminis]